MIHEFGEEKVAENRQTHCAVALFSDGSIDCGGEGAPMKTLAGVLSVEEPAMGDFWVTIIGSANAEKNGSVPLAPTVFPVKSPIPMLANLPGKPGVPVYMLDLSELSNDKYRAIAEHVARKFSEPLEEVLAGHAHGRHARSWLRIVCSRSHNPQRWAVMRRKAMVPSRNSLLSQTASSLLDALEQFEISLPAEGITTCLAGSGNSATASLNSGAGNHPRASSPTTRCAAPAEPGGEKI